MSQPVGINMFSFLRFYHMTEAELQEEIDSDRDLIRQGFMGEQEFGIKHSMSRLARELRHLDDEPMPEFHYISVEFEVMERYDGEEDPAKAKALLRRRFSVIAGGMTD